MTDAATLVRLRDFLPLRRRSASRVSTPLQLELNSGERVLIAGPDGSGKTDLLRAILGLLRHAGDARVLGGPPGHRAARAATGFGAQGRPFIPGLRVGEMVALVGRLRGCDAQAVTRALALCGLDDRHDADPMRVDAETARRTSLAMAAVGEPRLVVLDDPWESPETLAVLDAARKRGAAAIIATAEVGGLPDHVDRRIDLEPPESE